MKGYGNEQILTFSAIMVTSQNDSKSLHFGRDSARRFLIQYFLDDKTTQIVEEKQKMNGYAGGRFLNRMKVRNDRTGQYYTDTSFAIGEQLYIASQTFELINAPEYTLALMESNPERFRQCDMEFSIDSLSHYLDQNGIDLNSLFEEKDITNLSYVSREEAEEILFSFAPSFSKQCAITILRRLTYDDSFDYVELMKNVNFDASHSFNR